MKSVNASVKRTLVGAAAVVALALAAPGLSMAEETDSTSEEQEEESVAMTTEEKICEAQQRTEARYQKWINEGIPEEFGSEEPFEFDPEAC